MIMYMEPDWMEKLIIVVYSDQSNIYVLYLPSPDQIKDDDILHSLYNNWVCNLIHQGIMMCLINNTDNLYYCGNFVNNSRARYWMTLECETFGKFISKVRGHNTIITRISALLDRVIIGLVVHCLETRHCITKCWFDIIWTHGNKPYIKKIINSFNTNSFENAFRYRPFYSDSCNHLTYVLKGMAVIHVRLEIAMLLAIPPGLSRKCQSPALLVLY